MNRAEFDARIDSVLLDAERLIFYKRKRNFALCLEN